MESSGPELLFTVLDVEAHLLVYMQLAVEAVSALLEWVAMARHPCWRGNRAWAVDCEAAGGQCDELASQLDRAACGGC